MISTYPTRGDGISHYTDLLVRVLDKRVAEVATTRINFLKNPLSTFLWIFLLGDAASVLHLQYTPTGAGPLVVLYSLLRSRRQRFVITAHETPSTYAKHLPRWLRWAYRLFERTVLRSADMVTVHTRQHASELVDLGIAPSRISVLFIPVYPPDNAQDLERDRSRGVLFGRITPKKGIEHLLGALHELPDISFEVIGEPAHGCREYAEELRRSTRRQNLESRMRFRGFLGDAAVSVELSKAGFAIFPYNYITQSASLLTAVGHRLPYVASDLPAFREFHQRHGGGVLFESGRVASLARAIRDLQQEKTYERCLSELSAAVAELGWDRYVRKLVEIYEPAA